LHATHSIGRGRFPNRLSRHCVGGDRRGDGTGILWTCLFVCQDSLVRILLRSYSGDGNRLRALFCSHVFGDHFPCLARSAAHDLAPAGLANAAVDASPWHDFVGMLALKIIPLVDFSAIVWVAPVLVAALSVFILHEKVSPGLWASVFAGVWVIIGRTGMDFSLSMLFPFLAALANALYQITTRLLHGAD
jgi:drug/metabolite transporter (DMT)-like permease